MLPTNQKAPIMLDEIDNIIRTHRETEEVCQQVIEENLTFPNDSPMYIFQHLYILSDEEIQKGDYGFDGQEIFLAQESFKNKLQGEYIDNSGWFIQGDFDDYYHKIISTTNPKLNLPAPSQEFIKAYCDKGGVDEVLVEYEELVQNPKASIFERVLGTNLKVKENNTIIIKKIKTYYTSEEMYMNMQYYMEYCQNNEYITPQYWEENLKTF